MAVTTDKHRGNGHRQDSAMRSAPAARQTATPAAARTERAGLLLGAFGLASSLFVLTRLLEGWRVSPGSTEHAFSLLGQRLSYPAANLAAWVILALAGAGLAVTLLAVVAAVRELAGARRLGRWLTGAQVGLVHGALVIADDRPRAFCAGLISPRIYISTGAIAVLDDRALQAVLAHERHHAVRRDPLRLAVGRVFSEALFFLPGLRELIRRQRGLTELSADDHALWATSEDRPALARAMLVFSEDDSGEVVGIAPERVDHLMGAPPKWRFPVLLCAGAAAVSALVVAVGVLAGQLAAGTATLAPPFISRQPCVVVLALIPCGLALAAARVALTVRRRAS